MKLLSRTRCVWIGLGLLLAIGLENFFHHNYFGNTQGFVRALNLAGLQEFVCQGAAFDPSAPDHCGKRSLWRYPDWGGAVHQAVYGVDSSEEALSIVNFVVAARNADGQQDVPIQLDIYRYPLSQANSLGNPKIIELRLPAQVPTATE